MTARGTTGRGGQDHVRREREGGLGPGGDDRLAAGAAGRLWRGDGGWRCERGPVRGRATREGRGRRERRERDGRRWRVRVGRAGLDRRRRGRGRVHRELVLVFSACIDRLRSERGPSTRQARREFLSDLGERSLHHVSPMIIRLHPGPERAQSRVDSLLVLAKLDINDLADLRAAQARARGRRSRDGGGGEGSRRCALQGGEGRLGEGELGLEQLDGLEQGGDVGFGGG